MWITGDDFTFFYNKSQFTIHHCAGMGMPGLLFFTTSKSWRCLDATSVLVVLISTLIYASSTQNPQKNDCYDFRAVFISFRLGYGEVINTPPEQI